jgi:hypothetical protein
VEFNITGSEGRSRDCCNGVMGGHAIEPGRLAKSVLNPDGDA